ncbi:MAG: type II toxin-antitoxin system VapC family toxin [Actinomycetota bacterium]|jgi:predicted nucleic acid-binding protein|nr:type II toxin-antitoxin system VapC family toxin [Solirubrobacterales bacterium]MDQ3410057.1 type II toxin-antitoxin system VapC family toxin [Actinomycetota bacterium]
MPTSGEQGPDLLVDTSVAVALAVGDHEHHATALEALAHRRLGLAGHAAFETFSVLTRLPPPARRTPEAVARLLASNFPHSRYLGPGATAQLFERLARAGIAGGSVYDALVGAAAVEHDLHLATRDRRALDTYRKLDVRVELLA